MASLNLRSRFFIPLLLTAVLLVSGCVGQTAEEEGPTGTEGLVLSFFAGAPPSTAGEGETFDAVVSVENLGDQVISAGDASVYLRGVNPSSFGYGTSSVPVEMLTQSDLIAAQEIEGQIVGGQDAITWQDLCYEVDLTSAQTVNFIAQSCYLYKGTSRFDACFNQNPYRQTTGTETCNVVGGKLPVNTRSPVQVTEVSESPAGETAPNQPKFRFIVKVANLGSGRVYDAYNLAGGVTSCVDAAVRDLNRIHLDKISVGTDIIVENGLDASGGAITSSTWLTDGTGLAYFKLVNGEGQFIFTYEPSFVAGATIYSEPVSVEFVYGYTDEVSTSTTIAGVPDVVPAC